MLARHRFSPIRQDGDGRAHLFYRWGSILLAALLVATIGISISTIVSSRSQHSPFPTLAVVLLGCSAVLLLLVCNTIYRLWRPRILTQSATDLESGVSESGWKISAPIHLLSQDPYSGSRGRYAPVKEEQQRPTTYLWFGGRVYEAVKRTYSQSQGLVSRTSWKTTKSAPTPDEAERHMLSDSERSSVDRGEGDRFSRDFSELDVPRIEITRPEPTAISADDWSQRRGRRSLDMVDLGRQPLALDPLRCHPVRLSRERSKRQSRSTRSLSPDLEERSFTELPERPRTAEPLGVGRSDRMVGSRSPERVGRERELMWRQGMVGAQTRPPMSVTPPLRRARSPSPRSVGSGNLRTVYLGEEFN